MVILPDGGRNYLSKLYNDEWMRNNGLLATTGAVVRVGELLADRHHGPDLPTSSSPGRRTASDRRSTCSSATASASCPCRSSPTAIGSRASWAR